MHITPPILQLAAEMGEDFVAVMGDEEGMLPLGTGLAVGGARYPAVGIKDGSTDACVDHRLNCEDHSFYKRNVDIVVVVGDFRGFMEMDANAMADELIDNRTILRAGIVFDRSADVRNLDARLEDGNRALQTFTRSIDNPFFFFADLADHNHRTAIAIVAVKNGRYIDIEDIPILQLAVIGYAMADHLVKGRANAFWIRRAAVAERSGDGVAFFVQAVSVSIELVGRDAGLRHAACLAEDPCSQLAGSADSVDLLGRFEDDLPFTEIFAG